MATSGTYTFTLDIIDVIEEAYERLGMELRTGYDIQTARRSLNLLLTDWTNTGVNLWTLDQTVLDLTASTASYALASPALDVLDATIRIVGSTNTDYSIERISMEEYLSLPDKATEGRPTQYAVERLVGGPTVFLYPVPDVSTYDLFYYRIREIEDVSATLTQNPDVPKRFLPALCSGLAFQLGMKHPAKMEQTPEGKVVQGAGVSAQQLGLLKAQYTEDFQNAREQDRDRASFHITPWAGYGRR